MEDKKTLKELYEILFENIKDKPYIHCLCNEITELFDSHVDKLNLIQTHFKSQRYLHPEFMTFERNWNSDGLYWWHCWEDANPINRKAFIKKIISTL
jgi:hypothetical protein